MGRNAMSFGSGQVLFLSITGAKVTRKAGTFFDC